MRFDDLAGRDVVVWGAGREGRAAVHELARRGVDATVVVSDPAHVPSDVGGVVAGEAATARLLAADVVVRSPGVPDTSPDMLALRRAGVAVTGLTALWLADNHARTIAVTGTKGKSTTSALAHHVLTSIGTAAVLVGNGGTPVTEDDRSAAVAVAEVSSYQAADVTCSPRVVVVTCLYPEHLPWHGGYDAYVSDKLNLLAHGTETAVVGSDRGETAELVAARLGPGGRMATPDSVGLSHTDGVVAWAGVEISVSEVPVRGDHNVANVLLALTAVDAVAGLDAEGRAAALRAVPTFTPLAHRLEVVPSSDERTWVDDGLATAPEAVVAALETFATDRVSVIVGGEDRGLDLEPLVAYLETAAERVEVVTVGAVGHRFAEGAAGRVAHVVRAGTFAAALDHVQADAFGADVVLLSPAAPSFDEFTSYEERSAAFAAAARR